MNNEVFAQAVQLDGRIKNVGGVAQRLLAGNNYEMKLTGLPDDDREAIRTLVMNYLEAEEAKARALFDAL